MSKQEKAHITHKWIVVNDLNRELSPIGYGFQSPIYRPSKFPVEIIGQLINVSRVTAMFEVFEKDHTLQVKLDNFNYRKPFEEIWAEQFPETPFPWGGSVESVPNTSAPAGTIPDTLGMQHAPQQTQEQTDGAPEGGSTGEQTGGDQQQSGQTNSPEGEGTSEQTNGAPEGGDGDNTPADQTDAPVDEGSSEGATEQTEGTDENKADDEQPQTDAAADGVTGEGATETTEGTDTDDGKGEASADDSAKETTTVTKTNTTTQTTQKRKQR